MSTFADVKEIRLVINDPSGFVDFVQVANDAALPIPPIPRQTAYCSADTGNYSIYEDGTWKPLDLRISDARLGALVDSVGQTKAVEQAISAIVSKLGDEMRIVQNSDGAEGTTFTSLSQLYSFYKNFLADWRSDHAEASSLGTPKYIRTKNPTIAGGNV